MFRQFLYFRYSYFMSRSKSILSNLETDYTKVPNQLTRLGPYLTKRERRIYPYAVSVYLALAGSAEWFDPGRRHLRKTLGFSKDTIKNAFTFLIEQGLLVERPHANGSRAEYQFTPVEQWKASHSIDQAMVQDGVGDINAKASHAVGHNNNKKQKIKKVEGKFSSEDPKEESAFIIGSEPLANTDSINPDYDDLPLVQPDSNILPPTHTVCSSDDVFAELGFKE